MLKNIESDLLEVAAARKALDEKIAETEAHIGMLKDEFAAEAATFLADLHPEQDAKKKA